MAYPNPVSNQLLVEYDLVDFAQVELKVFNGMGALVKLEKAGLQVAENQQLSVEMGQLPAGMYLIQLSADGVQAGTLRILKQ